MKKVLVYETHDKQIFDSYDDANKYLDKKYGNLLTRTVNKLLDETDGKYQKMVYWLDENLNTFLILNKIKNDMELESIEENRKDNE